MRTVLSPITAKLYCALVFDIYMPSCESDHRVKASLVFVGRLRTPQIAIAFFLPIEYNPILFDQNHLLPIGISWCMP
jgi:hypothetical protein